jgi:hypothetical protein
MLLANTMRENAETIPFYYRVAPEHWYSPYENKVCDICGGSEAVGNHKQTVDTITITMGSKNANVGDVIHNIDCGSGALYTLKVISKQFDEPNGFHPAGVMWYTVLRTYGTHC